MLRDFVDFIEAIEERIDGSGTSKYMKFLLHATLVPKIRREDYDNYLTWGTPVGYRGPYTMVSYENKKYGIKRCDGETDYYGANGGHCEGVLLELEICNEDKEEVDGVSVSLGSVLGIIGEKSRFARDVVAF